MYETLQMVKVRVKDEVHGHSFTSLFHYEIQAQVVYKQFKKYYCTIFHAKTLYTYYCSSKH